MWENQRRQVFGIFVIGAIGLMAAPARAELLWDDPADLERRIDATMRRILPARCLPPKPPRGYAPKTDIEPDMPALIGYNEARATGPREIAYEVVVRIDKACFETASRALQRRVARGKPIFSVKVARAVEQYYDADGGPTFIFRFNVTAAEARSVDRG